MSECLRSELRYALWGCEMPWMRGDNLAVTLCSCIEGVIEHGPEDGDTGWPVEVNEAFNATTDELLSRFVSAIEPHFTTLRARAEAAEAERDAMREVVEACEPFLKPEQSPSDRMKQDHEEILGLMRLLAKEKKKNEVAKLAIQDVISTNSKNTMERDRCRYYLERALAVVRASHELQKFFRRVVGGNEAPVSIFCEDVYAATIAEKMTELERAISDFDLENALSALTVEKNDADV